MIKAIIIDDQTPVRDLLKLMIEESIDLTDLKVIGEAANVENGIKIINENKFDILFLDIKLGTLDGFDLLKMIENDDFFVIFISDYDEYLHPAIHVRPIDYLLKPFTDEQLVNAIERFRIVKAKESNRIDTHSEHFGEKKTKF